MAETRLHLDPEGLRLRREVIGNTFVDASLESADDFSGPLQEIITNHVWARLWTRTDLDRGTRSLVTVAILAAINRPVELELHVGGALRNGCSPAQIREVLLQCSAYCGLPAAVDAFSIARPAIERYDAEDSRSDSGQA